MSEGSDGVVDLGRARRSRQANKSWDARAWTPEDAVLDWLEEYRALPEAERPTRLILLAERDADDGPGVVCIDRYAGVTTRQAAQILDGAHFKAMLNYFDVRRGDKD